MRFTSLFGVFMLLIDSANIVDPLATYTDDLTGWGYSTSTCGSLGTMVGGLNVAGQDAVLEKIFSLPSASCTARIQLNFIKIDTWDGEMAYVKINDELKWTGGPWGNTDGPSNQCGRSDGMEASTPVDITTTEKNQILKITVDTNLNSPAYDEAFGIKNIRITPECSGTVRHVDLSDAFQGDRSVKPECGTCTKDEYKGQAFLLYHDDDVRTSSRFTRAHGGQFDNTYLKIHAVKHESGHWRYDTNVGWSYFTPEPTDVLIAEIDYAADTCSILNTQSMYEGIRRGVLNSDLECRANKRYSNAGSGSNIGEFYVQGTYFDVSEVAGCDRPHGWCGHPGAVYENIDCDNDGLLDHYCSDNSGNTGLVSFLNGCMPIWPTGTCLAKDDCVNNQCANGSTCVDEDQSYSCTCVVGYHGDLCENANVCTCDGGSAVGNGDSRCDVDGANRCETCHDGYTQDGTVCNKIVCDEHEIVQLSNICFCAAESTTCGADKWCYDSQCNDSAKYPACIEHAYDPQSDDCVCGTSTTGCEAQKYCWNGSCSTNAECTASDDVEEDAFFGAFLYGKWNSTARSMTIKMSVPSDITVKSIDWNEASDSTLSYDQTDKKSWSDIDHYSEQCADVYALTVPQDNFFGTGSHFILNGTHLTTSLKVVSEEPVHKVIGGYDYEYTKSMTNNVPLLVNLVKRMTISTEFHTTIPPPLEKHIKLNRAYSLLVSEETNLLSECSATYGLGGDLTCAGLIQASDGMAQIDIDATSTGTQAQLNAAIKNMCDNGFDTTSYDINTICEISHDEFVFVKSSEDDFEISGKQTVTIVFEVHTRNCIDHNRTDEGIRVVPSSQRYIDETVATTTFTWTTEAGSNKIKQDLVHNLCVEEVTWTFAPAAYQATKYKIGVEFTLEENMGTFVSEANIELRQADVLDNIGLNPSIETYTDEQCTQQSSTFNIGQKFYAKISLSHMVVDAQTITCNLMTLKQVRGTAEKDFNLKDAEFQPYQSATVANSVVCGAELEAPLFASTTGYITTVEIEILVDFKIGSGADATTPNRRRLRIPIDSETAIADAREFRDPNEEMLSVTLELLDPTETMVGVSDVASQTTAMYNGSVFMSGFFFISGCLGAYGLQILLSKDKEDSEITPLLEL